MLKGYDQLLNLVLDEVEEEVQCQFFLFNQRFYRHYTLTCSTILLIYVGTVPTPRTRTLGLAVLRGPTITILSPVDGYEEIANPFAAAE